MTNEYVSINYLVDRDITSKKINMYQLQALKNDNNVKIVNIGNFNEIPIVPILKMMVSEFNCEMFSFSVAEDEIYNNSHLKMIGFLIQLKGKIVASLDFVFKPDTKITSTLIPSTHSGIFEIILTKRADNSTIIENVKTYAEYVGREESVHLLAKVLVEDVIG